VRRGEPLADQVGQQIDGEAIGEQSPFGVAAWTAGEEFQQRLALFPAEVWFLRGRHGFNVGPAMPVREASSCPRCRVGIHPAVPLRLSSFRQHCEIDRHLSRLVHRHEGENSGKAISRRSVELGDKNHVSVLIRVAPDKIVPGGAPERARINGSFAASSG
jgi:hypothetical protein